VDNITKIIKKPLDEIDSGLNKIYTANSGINEELIRFINGSDKRIRSTVAILYLKMYGAEITDDIITVLVSGELIHNASLLHDDVIDDADTRRGLPAIAKTYSPEISILLGDLLLSEAGRKLRKLDNKIISGVFDDCTRKMAEAEITQFVHRGKIPQTDKYIEICKGKTASLFEAMLKSAAVLSGLNEENAGQFANNFGILFQLKNDFDETSAKADEKNKIYTLKNILGIEKAAIFTDNYLRELKKQLANAPDNIYKKKLEALSEKR